MKLFNDVWYERATNYVENTVLEHELVLYKTQKIRKLYESLEHCLLDNLQYYNRILRTVILMFENRIIHNGSVIENSPPRKKLWKQKITPTQLYYLSMLHKDSLPDEILVAYPDLGIENPTFEKAFKKLHNYSVFMSNMAISCKIANTNKYNTAFLQDLTDSAYLSKVLATMTLESLVINDSELSKAIDEVKEVKRLESSLSSTLKLPKEIKVDIRSRRVLFTGYSSEYECYLTAGGIVRMPLRGDYCIDIEEQVQKHIRDLYTWRMHVLKAIDNATTPIRDIARHIIHLGHRNFVSYKFCENSSLHQKCYIKKLWQHYRLYEEGYENGKLCYIRLVASGKLERTLNYLMDNGFYVFGTNENIVYGLAKTFDAFTLSRYYKEFIDESTISLEDRKSVFRENLRSVCTVMEQAMHEEIHKQQESMLNENTNIARSYSTKDT